MKKNYIFQIQCNFDFKTPHWNTFKSQINILFFLIFVLLGTLKSYGQSPFIDNTPNGSESFIVPTGVTSITVSVWGAGGGGGGSNSSGDGGSGGGGGGATTRTITVTPGDVFTYTVGTGGAGGLSTAGIGGNGTNSTFINVGLSINMIGNFGTGGGPNRGAAGIGGNASGGTTNMSGQNGSIGNASGQAGGNSGAVVGIFGFGGAAITNSTGNPGSLPGAGGGGGERAGGGSGSRAGGAGANGQIRITYTCPTYIVSAGPDQMLPTCATTATLSGSVIPPGTTGTWTLISGAATFTNPNIPNTGITGLVPGTPATLRWTISNGSCGNTSDDVVITPVIGGGCAPYCIPNYTTSVDPITNVTFAGINNNTSNVVNGTPDYQIFFSPTATVEQGETYPISISANTVGNNNYGVSIFFDWNQDGDFADAGEGTNVGVLNNITVGPQITANVTIPLTALTGSTRMRITFLRNAYSGPCTSGAQRGQIEDYIVNISPVTCRVPTAVNITAITGTTATINWTAPTPAPANGYEYYISNINAAPNSIPPLVTAASGSVGAGILFANVTGLTPGMLYYVWVRSRCSASDTSVWTATAVSFTTTLTNNDCAGAINIPVNAGSDCIVGLEGTTEGATQTLVACAGSADDDVWYRFTATATSHTLRVVPFWRLNNLLQNPVFQVFSGTCGTLIPIPVTGCVNAVATNTPETQTYAGLIPGNTYYVRVHSFANTAASRGNFTICVTTTTMAYCYPTHGRSDRYLDDYNTTGPMTNAVNMDTKNSITGYRDFTSNPPVVGVQGGGVNIDLYLERSRQFIKTWVDWNNDGVFTDAAPELVYDCGGVSSIATSFGFVVPIATVPGNYRMRIRTESNETSFGYAPAYPYGPCGHIENGDAEDYFITVIADCSAKITSVTDGSVCDNGTVNLSATASGTPTQYRWYANETGGAPLATTATGNWTTPSISSTTTYWVTAFNGCESLLRTKVIATVFSTAIIYVTPSVPEVCGENNVISVTAAGDFIKTDLINEKFEGAGLGTMTSTIIGGAGDALTQWQKRTSTFVPVGSVWKPAINSRETGNGFAFTTSDYNLDVNVALQSAVFDTTTFSDLTLEFRHYYSYYGIPYDGAFVEVSTDGGTVWNPVITYNSDQAVASKFDLVSIDMSAYINQPTLSIRFRYNAKFCDGWAVDDINLYGNTPLNTTFSWSGGTVDAFIDGACTIPYVAQSVSTVFVRPTPAQLAASNWSFTATATLFNGCPVSKLITIDNKTKLWKGTDNTDWNDADNWEPTGVPDANTCVIIYDGPNDARIVGSFYNAFAKYVIVRPSGDLLVNTDNTLTITDNLNVEAGGTATFQNGSSLLQTSNMPNIGNIIYRRTTNIRRLDYVYWSSPVASFSNSAVSPGTSLGFQYKWLPTTGGINNFGNWTNANETMVLGKGYAIRGDNSFPYSTFTNYTASFDGVPNNGDITIPISRGTWNGGPYSTGVSSTLGLNEDDNWNLVGNPFPSAIDAIDFLTLNTNIEGFVNIWTHGTLPSNAIADPFYANYVYNYTAADYITYNSLGASSGPGTFNGYINAGQGFFVSMRHTSAATTENLLFNNSLRSNGYNNNQFYKTTGNSKSSQSKSSEKHRIWFDLIPPTGSSIRALLGYSENATNDVDRLFDAFSNEKLSLNIFSITNNEKMLIQGRKLPFDTKDEVNIGVTIPQDGLYKIALSAVDGLFLEANQNIYLEDKLINVIYNIKEAPYSFIGNKGTISDRFVIRFEKDNKTSNTNELSNLLQVYDNKVLTVASSKIKIKKIEIFDLLGKQLFYKDNIDDKNLEINSLNRTKSLIVVKIVLENYTEEIRKVLY